MWGHKARLGELKITELVSSIFSNHKAMRLEFKYKKKILQTHGG